MKKYCRYFIVSLFIILISCSSDDPTGPTLSITGTAKISIETRDRFNNALGDSTIFIEAIKVLLMEDGEAVRTTYTDESGVFIFNDVNTGTYSLKAATFSDVIESVETEPVTYKTSEIIDTTETLTIIGRDSLAAGVVNIDFPYPNPTISSNVNIKYYVSAGNGLREKVIINIYDSASNLVKSLINHDMENGEYYIVWDLTDNKDRSVPAGLYYVIAKDAIDTRICFAAIKKNDN